jgi:dTDP-4-amino-4,6-dideoxygalactose transaminase
MVIPPPSKRIFLSSPEFDGRELFHIQEALQSGHIATSGTFITEFENKLEEKCGGGCVIALNSGTSAIHLALILLGVGQGDEVICQSLTFTASANPIIYLGAQPIFVDSESTTWNICPELLEEAILDRISKGKRPKAIITVNLFGMPAQMPAVIAVAARYGIPVLEDAAESLGSKINGQYSGTFGDIGIYSFNGNKVITTGGGGALVTANLQWAKKARHLSTQAKDNYPYYEHSEIGYNYKMNNLAAGIGLAQLERLEERIHRRRAVFEHYKMELARMSGISFLQEPQGYHSNRWLTTVGIDPEKTGFDADTLRLVLENNNIESRPVWKPMHLQPVFKSSPCYGGKVAAGLFERGLCLPSSSSLNKEDLDRVLFSFFTLYHKVHR